MTTASEIDTNDPRRAAAFNAIAPTLHDHDQWLPLTVRQAIADAVLAALGPTDRASQRREVSAASDDGLRDQYATAIVRGGGCVDLAAATDAVLAVRDRRMEQLAAGRKTWKAKAEEIEADRDRLLREFPWLRASDEDRQQAEAKLAAVRALTDHILTALDGPAPHEPVYDAVRDGHHDLDQPTKEHQQ